MLRKYKSIIFLPHNLSVAGTRGTTVIYIDTLGQWLRDCYCPHYACTCWLIFACHNADTLTNAISTLNHSYYLIWDRRHIETKSPAINKKQLKKLLRLDNYYIFFFMSQSINHQSSMVVPLWNFYSSIETHIETNLTLPHLWGFLSLNEIIQKTYCIHLHSLKVKNTCSHVENTWFHIWNHEFLELFTCDIYHVKTLIHHFDKHTVLLTVFNLHFSHSWLNCAC